MGLMRTQRFVIVVLLGLLLLQGLAVVSHEPLRAAGREIYVDDTFHLDQDGTAEHPYRFINDALSAANDGDTIYLYGGIYNESLSVTKRVSIIGSIDEGITIIDRISDHDYTISMDANFATLENVTVRDTLNYLTGTNDALIRVTAHSVIIQKTTCNESSCWGILLDHSGDNTIVGNTVNITRGISVQSSDNNVFSSNLIRNASEAGISMLTSNNNIIYNNRFENCSYGIYARDTRSSNISNNTIKLTDLDGIYLYQDQGSILKNNTIQRNVIGMKLSSSGATVKWNSLDHNQIGMSLSLANSLIQDNVIKNSSSAGITVDSWSHGNVFTQNHLTNNSPNARDSGTNTWESDGCGNYWSDYNNIDLDHNGIGDVVYRFTNGQDAYPLGDFLKAPHKPSKPSPADDRENVGLKVTLFVHVNDTDSPYLTVTFYNAANDQKLGTERYVKNNTNASCLYTFPFDTTFAWYAVSNDSLQENRSDIWFFTTRQRPPLNKKPVADPGGPYRVRIDQLFTLDGSGSFDPDSNQSLLFYRWNFGDGTSEILAKNPAHNYSKAGIYNITLTVVDVDGRSNFSRTTVTVAGALSDNKPPVAVIAPTASLLVNQFALFNASGSYDTDGSVVSYRWDYNGDGVYDTDWNPSPFGSYVYSTAGSYAVILQIKDDTGTVTTANAGATVAAPPKKTPGFEVAGVLGATAVALVLLRKRK